MVQVNEAVEHAADLAEGNMKMLVHARGGGRMPTQDWKRAQALLVNVAVITLAWTQAMGLTTLYSQQNNLRLRRLLTGHRQGKWPV